MIDKDSFCRLIKQNEKAMYSVAFSILSNESDAADAISESIYRAYKIWIRSITYTHSNHGCYG